MARDLKLSKVLKLVGIPCRCPTIRRELPIFSVFSGFPKIVSQIFARLSAFEQTLKTGLEPGRVRAGNQQCPRKSSICILWLIADHRFNDSSIFKIPFPWFITGGTLISKVILHVELKLATLGIFYLRRYSRNHRFCLRWLIGYMTSSFLKNVIFHGFFHWFVVKGGYFDRRSHLEALEKWIYFHFWFKCRTQKIND